MKILQWTGVSFAAAVVCLFGAYYWIGAYVDDAGILHEPFWVIPIGWFCLVVSLLCFAIQGLCARSQNAQQGALRGRARKWWHVWLWVAAGGAIGTVIGYVGAVLLLPNNNLAPLYGFAVTGPCGAALGLLIGGIRYRDRAYIHGQQKSGSSQ